MTRLDVCFNLGLAFFFVGILLSVIFFAYYGGRPEGIDNTRVGSFLVEKIEAGNNIYINMAFLCLILAAIGLVMSGISFLIKHFRKQSQNHT